jgi:hypothetical protein
VPQRTNAGDYDDDYDYDYDPSTCKSSISSVDAVPSLVRNWSVSPVFAVVVIVVVIAIELSFLPCPRRTNAEDYDDDYDYDYDPGGITTRVLTSQV